MDHAQRAGKKVRRGNPKTFSFKTKQEVRGFKISQKRKNSTEKQKDGAKKKLVKFHEVENVKTLRKNKRMARKKHFSNLTKSKT